MTAHRGERLNALFRREIARLVLTEIKDPRVSGAAISGVRASRDLSHATVWVRPPPGGDVADVIAGLERASGFIRGELGRRLTLRKIPEFRFVPDETLEHASRIEELLRQARTGAGPREP